MAWFSGFGSWFGLGSDSIFVRHGFSSRSESLEQCCSIRLWTDIAIGWGAWCVSIIITNLWFSIMM
ncbi:hypothetical protein Hdeb2414_s0016g00493091 [Helianthus debilis subsp. tardiflorus]